MEGRASYSEHALKLNILHKTMHAMKTILLRICRSITALVITLAAPLPTLSLVSLTAALCISSTAEASNSRDLLRRARSGDVKAMRRLAQRLWDGTIGRGRDCKSAVGWWKKAAEAGDARSMVKLGDLYAQGIYFSQNREKAIKYYQKAAADGYAPAEKRLARLNPKEPLVQNTKSSDKTEKAEENVEQGDLNSRQAKIEAEQREIQAKREAEQREIQAKQEAEKIARINALSPSEKLFYGINTNEIKWVKKALDEGVDINKPVLRYHRDNGGYRYNYPIFDAIQEFTSHKDDTILNFLIQSGAKLNVRQQGMPACLFMYVMLDDRDTARALWSQYGGAPTEEEVNAVENMRFLSGTIIQILPNGLLLYDKKTKDIFFADFGSKIALRTALQEALISPAELDKAIILFSSQGRHQYTTVSGATKTIKAYKVIPKTLGIVYKEWEGSYEVTQVRDSGLLVVSADGTANVQFVVGHPQQREVVDGDIITIEGVRTGVYKYTTAEGVQKVIPLIQYRANSQEN